jgi:hypothetical protein
MGDSAIEPGRPDPIAANARRGWSFYLRIAILVGIGALALIAIFPDLIGFPTSIGGGRDEAVTPRRPVLWGIEGNLSGLSPSRQKIDTLDWSRHGLAVGQVGEPRDLVPVYRWDDFEESGWRVVANYEVRGELDEVSLECKIGGGAMTPLERARRVFDAFGLPGFGAKLSGLLTIAESQSGKIQSVRADNWRWTLVARKIDGDVEIVRARRAGRDDAVEILDEHFDLYLPRFRGSSAWNNRGEIQTQR